MANIQGLSVKDKKKHDDITARVRAARSEYNASVDAFNAEQKDAWADLAAAVAAHNERMKVAADALRAAHETVSDVFREGREFAENVAGEIAADADNKSDRWKESRRGIAAVTLAETWAERGGALDLGMMEWPYSIDIDEQEQDGVEEIDSDCVDEFADLPSTPDSEPE